MHRFSILTLILLAWPQWLAAQVIGDAPAEAPPAAVAAGGSPWGLFVSPTISTLGLGLEVGVRPSELFGMRFGGNWLGLDFERSIDDVDYDVDATLASLGALLDYHPFRGGFRLSGGVRFNFNNADLTGSPDEDITIGDQTFSPAQVGTLKGEVSFDTLAPYAGIGYGATLLEGALSIGFDLGVMYQGSAAVDLDAENGALAGDPVLEANLAIEEDDVEDDLDDFVVYPVVGLAITYRF